MLLSATGALLISFGLSMLRLAFVALSEPDSRKSFVSNETAAQYVRRAKWDAFRSDDDKSRARLLVIVHPALLRLCAGDAQQWILANWARGEMESPTWLTHEWKASLSGCVVGLPSVCALVRGTSTNGSASSGRRHRRSFVQLASLVKTSLAVRELALPMDGESEDFDDDTVLDDDMES